MYPIQNTPMDFHVPDDKKFTDMVSVNTLQLTLSRLPLVEFWYSIKEECAILLKYIIERLPVIKTA